MTTKLSERLRGFALDASRHLRPQLVDQLRELVAQAEAQEKLAYFEGRVKPSSDDPEAQAGELSDDEIKDAFQRQLDEAHECLMGIKSDNVLLKAAVNVNLQNIAALVRAHLKPSQAIGEQTPVVRYSITHAAGILPPWGIEHTQLRFNSRGEAAAVCNELNNRSPVSPEARDRAIEALATTQHLWMCEDEGMVSGQPTARDYRRAREKVDQALSALRGEPGAKP